MKNEKIKLEKGESITTETVMDLLGGHDAITFDGYNQYTVKHDLEIIVRKKK